MRALSMALKGLLSNKVLMSVLYVIFILCSASLLVYGLLIDHQLVFEILLGICLSIMWLGTAILMLAAGFQTFLDKGSDNKFSGLFIGGLGALALSGYIAAAIHYFA